MTDDIRSLKGKEIVGRFGTKLRLEAMPESAARALVNKRLEEKGMIAEFRVSPAGVGSNTEVTELRFLFHVGSYWNSNMARAYNLFIQERS